MLLHEKKLFLGYGLLVVSVLMVVLGLFVTIANVACDANSTKDGAFCKAMGMDGDTWIPFVFNSDNKKRGH